MRLRPFGLPPFLASQKPIAGNARLLAALLGLALLNLTACNDKDTSVTPVPPVGTLHLVQAESDEALRQYLTEGLLNNSGRYLEAVIDDVAAEPAPPSSDGDSSEGGSEGDFSGTNLVEEGVDEADIAKFDGDYLYVADQPGYRYGLFSSEDDGSSGETAIHIFQSDRTDAAATPVARLPLTSPGNAIEGLYLNGHRSAGNATLLGISRAQPDYTPLWERASSWQSGQTEVEAWGINDINQPESLWHLAWEGHPVESRRVGNTLYVISRHSPALQGFSPSADSEADRERNQNLVDAVTLEELTPKLTINGTTQVPLFEASDCLLSAKPSSDWYRPTLLAITTIDLANPTQPTTLCTNADSGGIYTSANSLYVHEWDWEETSNASGTRIHKFALTAQTTEYQGSGRIDGSLWGSSSAFWMSETGDYLRVVSSEWTGEGPKHTLSVLKQEGTDLKEVARLPNEAQPDPIGKPGESIYGVRFLGDRAYIVTYETIDPLYVIDLSEPRQPAILGELEIDGVSDYLQLVDATTLLGIGRLDRQVQVSLFDITNPQEPQLASRLTVGEKGTSGYSPVFHDYKALAWLQDSQTGNVRLAFPAHSGVGRGQFEQHGLKLVTLDMNSKQVVDQGFASTGQDQSYGLERAVIDSQIVHYISNSRVWTAPWANPEQVTGPQVVPATKTGE